MATRAPLCPTPEAEYPWHMAEGMRHAEEVIDESTPQSVQPMVLRNVAGEPIKRDLLLMRKLNTLSKS